MKRKHVQSRGAEDKAEEENDGENSENGQTGSVKEKCDVPVVVRGALTNWPSLNWGEEGWLKVLGDQEIEVLVLFTWNLTKIC